MKINNVSVGNGPGTLKLNGSVAAAADLGLATDLHYLAKCQVDTPSTVVELVWSIVKKYRESVGSVLDAGAGDGRFSLAGKFDKYVGYELDPKRLPTTALPKNAQIVLSDAFGVPGPHDFDLAIGNPPYARHHDLADEWRSHVASWIESMTGVRPNGRSNAYLYFVWLGLIATKADGLLVYLVPFDWVTRPAARTLREYIASSGWKLDIYRFDNEPFEDVLTTACVVVIDKRLTGGTNYFRIGEDRQISPISSPTLTNLQPLNYAKSSESAFARRGLSPGDQRVFLLTESERVHYGLRANIDVIRAISSFKDIESSQRNLTESFFEKYFVEAGAKCWLINPDRELSKRMAQYLEEKGELCKSNSTCSMRDVWWKFTVPPAPAILYASGFRGNRPKLMLNGIGAIAVGAVCGVHTETKALATRIFDHLLEFDFSSQVVAMSRGFTKVEINQMNGVIQSSLE